MIRQNPSGTFFAQVSVLGKRFGATFASEALAKHFVQKAHGLRSQLRSQGIHRSLSVNAPSLASAPGLDVRQLLLMQTTAALPQGLPVAQALWTLLMPVLMTMPGGAFYPQIPTSTASHNPFTSPYFPYPVTPYPPVPFPVFPSSPPAGVSNDIPAGCSCPHHTQPTPCHPYHPSWAAHAQAMNAGPAESPTDARASGPAQPAAPLVPDASAIADSPALQACRIEPSAPALSEPEPQTSAATTPGTEASAPDEPAKSSPYATPAAPIQGAVFAEGYFRPFGKGGLFDMSLVKNGCRTTTSVGIPARLIERHRLQNGDLLTGFVIEQRGKLRLLEQDLKVIRPRTGASPLSQGVNPPPLRIRKRSLLAQKAESTQAVSLPAPEPITPQPPTPQNPSQPPENVGLAFEGYVRSLKNGQLGALVRVTHDAEGLLLESVGIPRDVMEQDKLQSGQRIRGFLRDHQNRYVLMAGSELVAVQPGPMPLPAGNRLPETLTQCYRAREVMGVFQPEQDFGYLLLLNAGSDGMVRPSSDKILVVPPIIEALKLQPGQVVRGLAYDSQRRHMRLYENGMRAYPDAETALRDAVPLVESLQAHPENKADESRSAKNRPEVSVLQDACQRNSAHTPLPEATEESGACSDVVNTPQSVENLPSSWPGPRSLESLPSMSWLPDTMIAGCPELEAEQKANQSHFRALMKELSEEYTNRLHYNLSPRRKIHELLFSEAVEKFLHEDIASKRPATQSSYKRSLRLFSSVLGHFPLQAIMPDHLRLLQRFFSVILVDGRPRKSGTINRDFAALSVLFSTAQKRWGILGENPVRQLEFLPEKNKCDACLTDDDRIRLVATVRLSSSRYLVHAFVLCLCTGLRKSEAVRLKWGAYDRRRLTLTILAPDSKGDATKEVQVVGVLRDVIETLWRATDDHSPDAPMFPGRGEKRPYDPRKAFETALKRARIEGFRLHDLRHTAGSYLAMCGATTRDIQKILGLSTTQMAERYTHLDDGYCRSIHERVMAQFPLMMKGQSFLPERDQSPISAALIELEERREADLFAGSQSRLSPASETHEERMSGANTMVIKRPFAFTRASSVKKMS